VCEINIKLVVFLFAKDEPHRNQDIHRPLVRVYSMSLRRTKPWDQALISGRLFNAGILYGSLKDSQLETGFAAYDIRGDDLFTL